MESKLVKGALWSCSASLTPVLKAYLIHTLKDHLLLEIGRLNK